MKNEYLKVSVIVFAGMLMCSLLVGNVLQNPGFEDGMTNWEITHRLKILNHTGRISDLRAAGFEVRAEDKGNGCFKYWLREPVDTEAILKVGAN